VMKGGADPVTLRGGAGNDTLTGSPGTETLDGGNGADNLNALGGWDTVLGGAGADTVEARDGQADTVDCGPDSDTVAADAIDAVTSCGTDPPPPAPVVITTPAPPVRVLFDLAYTFTPGRRGTTLRNLAVEVEPGARLTAACRTKKKKRCTRTKDLARTAASLRLKGFEGKRLPVGAKLTVRVTKAGMIGAVKTLTIRKRRAPSVTTRCLPPGATRPSAC
jgi:Ca2+-binding RTX toxin-like protein